VALAPSTRLGSYEVIALIGAGGMGEVYRARDSKLKRDVAIKVLPEAFARDPERLARFEREAEVLATLNHPNIAAVYGFAESADGNGIVLELVEGPTLADRIAKGPIPIDEAIPIAKQIVEAMIAAHERGIVHRDLKPANIKVTSSGSIKVLDFGLAKAADTRAIDSGINVTALPTITSPAMMTGVGVVLGTAAYMSPEQARGRAVDGRADIWAFGALFYEMLTGRRAFPGDDVTETIANIVKSDPDWGALPPDTSVAVRALLRRCLNKDPDRRLRHIADARFNLEDAETLALPAARSSAPMRVLPWAVAVCSLAAAVALGYLKETTPETQVTRFQIVTPATNDPFSFALSGDGRQIAFVADSEAGARLWIRTLDQIAPRVLAGTEGATEPFWSPDGRAIGFFADGKLKRVDVANGIIRVLADAPIPRGGSWNQDGVILFSPTVYTGLMRVSANGGTAMAVTQRPPAGEGTHRWPTFLPDSRQFMFLVALAEPNVRGLYLGALDGGTPRRVLAAEASTLYAAPGYLLLPSQRVLIAYRFDTSHGAITSDPITVAPSVDIDSGAATGLSGFSISATGVLAHRNGATTRRQLVWVDRAGREQGALVASDDTAFASPELAPDGRRVAILRNIQGNPDIWLIDAERGTASRFTYAPSLEQSVAWSPDGRRMVFGTNRKGRFDLFEKQVDGAADEQPLLVSAEDKSVQDWSRDGRYLLYAVQGDKTGSDLWVVPMVGERKPFPVLQSMFDEVHGQFSPDGHWLAYASNENGRFEVYVRTFPALDGKRQVSIGGGIYPRWRPDGRELFYVAPDNSLMAVTISGGSKSETIVPGTAVALFRNPRLAVAGNTGTSNFLARPPYAVTANGRFLLDVSTGDEGAAPITVVLNWTAGLKK
jgi:eukaryotic-like serine/threonine-protein kinase